MSVKGVIEIPAGSWYKYEVDKADGSLVVDRMLNQSVPFNYGFIPDTLCDDGDPLDVFVVSEHPIAPLAKVKLTILGVLICMDNGESDDKLLACIEGSPESEGFGVQKINAYLQSYKEGFEVLHHGDAEVAQKVLDVASARYSSYTETVFWDDEDL